jgi:hypothetical protein
MAESKLGPGGLVKDSAVNPGSLFNFDVSPGSTFGPKPKTVGPDAANKKAEADYIKNLQTPGFTGGFFSSDSDAMERVRNAEALYRPSAEVQAANEEARRVAALEARGELQIEANQEAFDALTPEQQNNIEQAIADPNSPLFRPLKFDEEGQVIPRTPDDAANAYGFLRRLGTTAGDIGQPKDLNLSSIFMPGGGADFGSANIGTSGFNPTDSTLGSPPNNSVIDEFKKSPMFTNASVDDKIEQLKYLQMWDSIMKSYGGSF